MLSPVLQHVLELIRRTGDRCVIVDSAKDEAFVLMSLAGYEQILGASNAGKELVVQAEESIEEKANREIAQWRQEEAVDTPAVVSAEKQPETGEEDRFYIEPVE